MRPSARSATHSRIAPLPSNYLCLDFRDPNGAMCWLT